jgi:hypothetical protein
MRREYALLALGAAVGMALALVDSLPQWDDSGILAGGLILSSMFISVLGVRKPWLLAIVLGGWMAVRDAIQSGDPRMLVLLAFPLVGAYAGAVVRRRFDARPQGG